MLNKTRFLIYRLLKIHHGEGKKLFLFSGLIALISISIGILANSVDSIFLKSADDAIKKLPILFIVNSIVLILVSLFYSSFVDRVNKRFTYQIVLLVTACLLIFCRMMLFTQDALWFALLYVTKFVTSTFLIMQYWELCNLYFNIREGKRLFPYIAVVGAVGYSIGSFFVAFLANIISSEDTLIVSAGFIVLVAFLLSNVSQYHTEIRKRKKKKRKKRTSPLKDLNDGLKLIKQSNFLRIFTLSTFIFGITSGVILYAYNDVVNNLIEGQDQLTSFLGVWRGVANILISVIQATLIAKLMSQAEIDKGWLQGIVIRTASLILVVFFFVFSMAATADFSRQMLQALMSPAAILAFAILPKNTRGRAMSLNNGVIAPLGMLVAGLALSPLVMINQDITNITTILICVFVLLIIVRLVLNVRINKEYLKKLSSNLKDAELDFSTIKKNIDMIANNTTLLENVFSKFKDMDQSFKMYLLNIFQPVLKNEKQAKLLLSFLPYEEDIVKARIISLLSEVPEVNCTKEVYPYIQSNFPQLKKNSMLYTLWFGDKALHDKICCQIEEMVQNDTSLDECLIGLALMGESSNIKFLPIVENKLESKDISIKKAVITAIKVLDKEKALEIFISKLQDDKLREHILREILELSLPKVEKQLIKYYEELDNSQSQIKLDIIFAFSKLQTSLCKATLIKELYKTIDLYTDENMPIASSNYLNTQLVIDKIIDALLKYNQDMLNLDKKYLLKLVRHESWLSYSNMLLIVEAHQQIQHRGRKLVVKLLQEEIDNCVCRIGNVLSLMTKSQEQNTYILKALKMLSSTDRRIKEQAIEVIDNVGDKDVLKYLLPFLENLSFKERVSLLEKHFRGKNVENIHYALYSWIIFEDKRPGFKYKKMIADFIFPQSAI